MNREEAYFYKILLTNGFSGDYDAWLDSHLMTENPLSDIVLELSLCGSDTNKTIHCLHNYCLEQPLDEKVVCDKLRNFLKDAYDKKLYTIEEICALMYDFALSHGDPGDFDTDIWGDMFYLDDYAMLVDDGSVSAERLESAVVAYLNDSTPIDYNGLWNIQKKQSLLDKIKNRFKK